MEISAVVTLSEREAPSIHIDLGPGRNRPNQIANTFFEYFGSLEFAIVGFAERQAAGIPVNVLTVHGSGQAYVYFRNAGPFDDVGGIFDSDPAPAMMTTRPREA